jgi:hypothetical protein
VASAGDSVKTGAAANGTAPANAHSKPRQPAGAVKEFSGEGAAGIQTLYMTRQLQLFLRTAAARAAAVRFRQMNGFD